MKVGLEERILGLLASHRGPALHVEAIASKLEVSSPFASQTLHGLERQGLVRRQAHSSPTGRKVVYALMPSADIRWVSPGEGVVLKWRALAEMDWDFPLLSQVPDAPARATIKDFLATLRNEGLLDAASSRKGASRKRGGQNFLGLTVIVFGSTARGTARDGADVDVFALAKSLTPGLVTRIHDVAAEVSLRAPRALQLLLFSWNGDWKQISPTIRPELERDGLIVHYGLADPGRGPEGFWPLVYGGRQIA